MSAINDRISQIVVETGLSKTEFAKRINVSQQYISKLSKEGVPSDRTIIGICREFNISEAWLRTGEGDEMFVRREPQPLEALLVEMLGAQNITDGDRVLMKNFLELSDASRQEVIAFVRRCAQELSQAPAEISKPEANVPQDIAAELAELKRQNQELAAKVAAMEEEDGDQPGLTVPSSASPSVSVGSFDQARKT